MLNRASPGTSEYRSQAISIVAKPTERTFAGRVLQLDVIPNRCGYVQLIRPSGEGGHSN